jgi:glycosyltransferase involved in cell wall biosynthesis
MDKDTVLFVDVTTPRPYDPSTIEGKGLGGTEQTMVCLAEGLASQGRFNVVVEQHNREDVHVAKATYANPGFTQKARWVITLRDPRPMLALKERFPHAKLYLWSHDLADRNLGVLFSTGVFAHSGCIANICVSNWHKSQTIETLKAFGYTGGFKNKVIYNPLSDDVVPTKEPYDKNKLMWLASPHKGLARAYDIFKCLIRINPNFRLYVTNPGYMEDSYANDPDVKSRTIVLGTLPHREAITHVRNSLCLFYPNVVFPETFGKIMAEANAVHTPVLTSPIGASYEILDKHPGQIVDCRDTEKVVKRVMSWYGGERPIVRGNPKFKLSAVIKEWEILLDELR